MPQKQKKKGGKSKSKNKQTTETKDDAPPPSGLPLKSILAAAIIAGAATLFSTTRSCGAPRVVEEGDLRYLVNNGGVGLRLLECKWPADGIMQACLFAQQQTCGFGPANEQFDSRCRDLAKTEACGEEDERLCKEAVAIAGRGVRSRISVFH